ncbi:MAG: YidH family protein [Gaiellaceae bacterium]
MTEPGVEDATRRTRLANERTYLAWWRTGLTSIAVAVGVGRIAPDVSNVTRWPYELVGAGFGVLGVAFIWFGYVRARAVEEALDRGSFVPLGPRLPLWLLVAGSGLGAAAVAIVIFGR